MKKLISFIEQQIYHFIFFISILCIFLFLQNWRLSTKVETLIDHQSKLENVLTNSSDKYIITKSLILQDTLVSNLNKLIPGTKYINLDLETLIKVADGQVYNNAAQVWNHNFYFGGLKPGNGNIFKGSLSEGLKASFGSLTFLKNSFIKTAGSLFGSGWIWLVLRQDGLMEVVPKSNAGNPLRTGVTPIMACDMWEHAYYLDYQNRRPDYLAAVIQNLINWDFANANLG